MVRKKASTKFKHHFIPHPTNGKRATLLSNHFISFYSIIFVLLLGFYRVIPRFAPGVLSYASDINVGALLEYTNKIRKEHGVPPLKFNAALSVAAANKAKDMFANNYWSHKSPTGVEPWDFILSSGYDYSYAGENLAKNFSSSDKVVSAWYDSESHRENLLSTHFEDVGFAVVNGVLQGYETTLVVQMFGLPRSGGLSSSPELTDQALVSGVTVTSPAPSSAGAPTRSQLYADAGGVGQINVSVASKLLLVSFAIFILLLLSLDIWYSSSAAVPKFTGHTFAHITLFLFILLSIWIVLTPGVVL